VCGFFFLFVVVERGCNRAVRGVPVRLLSFFGVYFLVER